MVSSASLVLDPRRGLAALARSRMTEAFVRAGTLEAMLTPPITGALLYDFVHCPHRVALDAFGDRSERDGSVHSCNSWERGSAFEKEVVAGLKIPFHDLATWSTSGPNGRRAITRAHQGDGRHPPSPPPPARMGERATALPGGWLHRTTASILQNLTHTTRSKVLRT
jgi:hypothetical protein